jgi:predicted nuclease with TOPRIM domain
MTNILDPAWEEFKRQWAVDGMPADKQRLARAAYECGQSSISDLRAEVASLKSDLESYMRIANEEANENVSLTQQLAAADGRVEMLRDAIENLRKVKGRHNTELACNRLFAALSNLKETKK